MAYAEPDPVEESDLDNLNTDLDVKDRKSRVEAAVAMAVAGANYSEIADVLGYATPPLARQAVERAIAATVSNEGKEVIRDRLKLRLDRLQRSVMPKAVNPDHPEHLSAVRTALALIDRYARLTGADAPTEHVIYAPTQSEMEAEIARLSALMRAGLPQEVDVIGGKVVYAEED